MRISNPPLRDIAEQGEQQPHHQEADGEAQERAVNMGTTTFQSTPDALVPGVAGWDQITAAQ